MLLIFQVAYAFDGYQSDIPFMKQMISMISASSSVNKDRSIIFILIS